LGARFVILNGLIWRVGNGRDIKIWGDRWLPNPSTFVIQTPCRILSVDVTVSNLIDPDTKSWNSSLISDIFMEEEAQLICNIPLSPLQPPDKMIWRCTKNGHFSVRSAYYMEKDIQASQRNGCSNINTGAEIWKVIWGLNVPNATKMFLWKACNNLLPTEENLFHRRVVGDQICPICTIEIESVLHILWECPAAVDVWSSGPRSLQKCSGGAVSLSSVLETLIKRCSSMYIEIWAVLARKLWLRRNSVVFGGVFTSPNQLMREVVISIEDFKRANVPTEKENDFQAIPVPPVQWKALSLGLYKINWDAAIDMKNRRMGVGIIARDYQGLVVAACSLTLHDHTDSLVAEAWAALHAIVLAKESGLLDIILEGDAL
jgi:hypothetical protein